MGKRESAPVGSQRDWRSTLAWLVDSKAFYAAIILFLALYVLTKGVVFAVLTALSLIALFIGESLVSASKGGWKHELTELGLTLLLAGAIWYGSGYLLQTSAPLDSIVSCSMLPNLERGDMVVLRGGIASAPEVNVSRAAFEANDWQNEQLVCAFCSGTNAPCAAAIRNVQDMDGHGLYVAAAPADQSNNLVQYSCGTCARTFANGTELALPCTASISIAGTSISVSPPSAANDVGARETIVYTPAVGDAFRGEIIHRVVARLNVNGSYYYLTKGDNNQPLDLQWGNSIIPQSRVVGRVALRLPYVGYLKLFLFGFFSPIGECDSVLVVK